MKNHFRQQDERLKKRAGLPVLAYHGSTDFLTKGHDSQDPANGSLRCSGLSIFPSFDWNKLDVLEEGTFATSMQDFIVH